MPSAASRATTCTARYYPEDREMLLDLPPGIDPFEVIADER